MARLELVMELVTHAGGQQSFGGAQLDLSAGNDWALLRLPSDFALESESDLHLAIDF